MKKKKKKTLNKAKLVKEMSRDRIGTVPPTKVVPQKKKRRASIKHKKRALTELTEA